MGTKPYEKNEKVYLIRNWFTGYGIQLEGNTMITVVQCIKHGPQWNVVCMYNGEAVICIPSQWVSRTSSL